MRAALTARVREGQTLETAARLAGIHRDTFHDWRRRGSAAAEARATGAAVDQAELPFLELHDVVEVARAQAQADAVLEVRAAGRAGNWQASRWFLERSFPEEWGAKSPTAVTIGASQSSLSEALVRGRAAREEAETRGALVDADALQEDAASETPA